MTKQVVFVILEQYSDWKYSFLAAALQNGILDTPSHYKQEFAFAIDRFQCIIVA